MSATSDPDGRVPASATSTLRIDKEMGITLKDFLRLLPAATASDPALWERTEGEVVIPQTDARRQVCIRHAPERVRRIASLALPVLSVTLLLSGFDEEEAERFLQCFDRHYQRGGG